MEIVDLKAYLKTHCTSEQLADASILQKRLEQLLPAVLKKATEIKKNGCKHLVFFSTAAVDDATLARRRSTIVDLLNDKAEISLYLSSVENCVGRIPSHSLIKIASNERRFDKYFQLWNQPICPKKTMIDYSNVADYASEQLAQVILDRLGWTTISATDMALVLKAMIAARRVVDVQINGQACELREAGLQRASKIVDLFLTLGPASRCEIWIGSERFVLGHLFPTHLDAFLECCDADERPIRNAPSIEPPTETSIKESAAIEAVDSASEPVVQEPWLRLSSCQLVDFSVRVPRPFFDFVDNRCFNGITFDWKPFNVNAPTEDMNKPSVLPLISNPWHANLTYLGLADAINAHSNKHTFLCAADKFGKYKAALRVAWEAWLETAPDLDLVVHLDGITMSVADHPLPLIFERDDKPRRAGLQLTWHPDLKLSNVVCEQGDIGFFQQLSTALAKLDAETVKQRPRLVWE